MYIVANISKSIISLSDLNITIPSNQSRDLHKLTLPIKADKSVDLQTAIKKGYLKVVKKDHKKKHVVKETHTNVYKGIDQETLSKVLRKELAKINTNNSQDPVPVPAAPPVDQSEVIKQMLVMMQQMQTMMRQQSSNNTTQNSDNDFDYDDIDIEQLAKIHSKAVKKLTQDAENSIEYQQEQTKDSGLASRADELSDIL